MNKPVILPKVQFIKDLQLFPSNITLLNCIFWERQYNEAALDEDDDSRLNHMCNQRNHIFLIVSNLRSHMKIHHEGVQPTSADGFMTILNANDFCRLDSRPVLNTNVMRVKSFL